MSDAATVPVRARKARIPTAEPAEPAAETATGSATDSGGVLPPAQARRPFGARRQRLENPPIPGYQCYWFNALPGRIEQALEAGYDHVKTTDGKPVCKVVGVMEGGGALMAYRMKIPREFYEQDQAEKERPRQETDAQMRAGSKDAGYAAQGRPGYTDAKASMRMDDDGRQTYGAPRKSE